MRIRLHATPDGDGWTIEGDVDGDTDQAETTAALAGWLVGIDPEELERVALERLGFGSESLTAEMLAVLAEWAGGEV